MHLTKNTFKRLLSMC